MKRKILMIPRIVLAALIAAAGMAPASLLAAEQDYPTRSVRFVVPFAAGSATDTLARLLGNHAGQALGQTVVIENIAGGSGIPAAQNVARSPPDGYTVFITSNTTHASNQSMLKRVPYDALTDFEPVTKLGTVTLALVGHPSVPADDVPGLIAYAKANPGKLTFGAGSASSRAAVELMKTMAGVDMLHVPYRANPMVVTDLLGGQISLFFGDIPTSLPPVRAGRLKGFAVSSLRRTPLAPDLPSLDEAGLKGYDLTAWFAAFVPARTPKSVIDKLRETLVRAVEDKAMREKLLQAGIEPDTTTSEGLRAFVQSEIKKWAEIVRAAGIEPE
jgi:tripartite-type tricarboxylate transporter receptor subunit TctC